MIIPTILFYAFAITMVLSALAVVSVKNPVHSVLCLIFTFFNAAGLFVLLGAEFIAMLMVIVYVGAVAVLFLFVVMMLNINIAELRAGFVKYLPVGVLVATVMFAELVFVIKYSIENSVNKAQATVPLVNGANNTKALGDILYTNYFFPFQISGLILLVAMIGAITLTQRLREGVRKQNISKQVNRKREDSIEVIKNIKSGQGV